MIVGHFNDRIRKSLIYICIYDSMWNTVMFYVIYKTVTVLHKAIMAIFLTCTYIISNSNSKTWQIPFANVFWVYRHHFEGYMTELLSCIAQLGRHDVMINNAPWKQVVKKHLSQRWSYSSFNTGVVGGSLGEVPWTICNAKCFFFVEYRR